MMNRNSHFILQSSNRIFSKNPLRPGAFLANYTPLAPLGLAALGPALVLIFWAYVGFEMGTLPAAR
jgi:hypothetical protein